MSYIEYLKKNHDYILKNKTNLFEEDINLIKYSNSCNNTRLRLELIPQPIVGDLQNAKIFFLSLNPGYCEDDIILEDDTKPNPNNYPYYRDILLNQLIQDGSVNNEMIWINEKLTSNQKLLTPGAKWWQGKIAQKDPKKSFLERATKESTKNKDEILDTLAKNVCAIELFPYHSKKMNKRLLLKCKSTQMIKDYVKNALVSRANRKEILICVNRSKKEWDICEGGNIIINNFPRRITFSVQSDYDYGKKIYCFSKQIGLF
ncbi:MAG: hypothetical protein KBT35_02135 [Firmicutes bacterium]|nr:hypothetical protein [Candidatus Colivicinus equi]